MENITSAGLNNNQDKRAFYDRWKNPGDRAKYKAINLTGSTQTVFTGEIAYGGGAR